MAGRTRTWLRDLGDLATIYQVLGSGSVAGIIALIGQEVLNAFLGLSPFVRVLFGICIFFLALAIILAGLKAFLEHQSHDEAAKDLTPQSSEYSLWQELKRVESENEQLKAALQKSEHWGDLLEPFKDRLQLRWTLEAIWRMGRNLHERQPPDVAAMEKWVSLTSSLLRKYLGDETANFFLVHDGDSSFAGRLRRLEQIFDKPVDIMVNLQSDFDTAEAIEPYPSEWANKYGV